MSRGRFDRPTTEMVALEKGFRIPAAVTAHCSAPSTRNGVRSAIINAERMECLSEWSKN
ncbi:hypothetical protein AND_010259 [Anopheles darlingi]|uniref:Uncharacterized protein n=1 Tax=Anopheles darlingi TaxID=43151 RepID=W5J2Y1_ANODA|nr:hypothetical protein AND_010259 [Anopheles darlingi]